MQPRRSNPEAEMYEHVWIDTKGFGLQATKNVRPGQRILSEVPLISFTPVPQDIIYYKNWLMPDKDSANGIDTFAADIQKLTGGTKKRFRKLHGSTPLPEGSAYADNDPDHREHDLRRIQRNAFSHTFMEGGLPYSVLRVFETISRINHSCRPNAVMSWNDEIEQGTVHAVFPITQGEEITIDYLPDNMDRFRSARERCEDLRNAYGFVCMCDACGTQTVVGRKPHQRELAGRRGNTRAPVGAGGSDADRDTGRRLELKRLAADTPLVGILTELDNSMNPAETETDRLQQLSNLDEYLTAMQDVGIRDASLANVYEARAKHLQMGARLAEYKQNNSGPDTADLPDETQEALLGQAVEAWDQCHNVHLRCSGADHPSTREVVEQMTSVKLMRLKLQD